MKYKLPSGSDIHRTNGRLDIKYPQQVTWERFTTTKDSYYCTSDVETTADSVWAFVLLPDVAAPWTVIAFYAPHLDVISPLLSMNDAGDYE